MRQLHSHLIGAPEDVGFGTATKPKGSLLHAKARRESASDLMLELLGRPPGSIPGRIGKVCRATLNPRRPAARGGDWLPAHGFRRGHVNGFAIQLLFVLLKLLAVRVARERDCANAPSFVKTSFAHQVSNEPYRSGFIIRIGGEQFAIQPV